ncbi:MAG TPA: glycosyltransferase family 2 protein [Baekduia sp.]|nr:glycosyltransferase family 2 protein [Baekduia sp.]
MSAVEPTTEESVEPPAPRFRSGRARVVGAGAGRDHVPDALLGAVSIVVPTYNTGAVIPAVLRALLTETGGVVAEILVIDNASTDDTADVVRAFIAREPGAAGRVRLLENPTNLGYGGSIKRGFADLVAGSEYVAVMHSDAQCDSGSTIRDMVAAFALTPQPDVVLASRFLPGAQTRDYNLARRAGNHFFNTFTRVVSGLRMSDAGTGIMLIRSGALSRMPFERMTSGYQFHPQLNLVIYSDPRLVIAEVPLAWRDAEVGVKFSLAGYAVTLTKMLLAFAWHRRVRRRPAADAVVAAAPEGAAT